jgi:hypothetical protein
MSTISSNQPNLAMQNSTSLYKEAKSLPTTTQPNTANSNSIEQDTVQISSAARQLFAEENLPLDTEPSVSADNGYGIRPPTGTTPPPTGGDGSNRDN